MVVASLGYVTLKLVGRHHSPPRKLTELIREHQESPGGADYHI